MIILLLIFWFFITVFSYDILVAVKIEVILAEKIYKMLLVSNFFVPQQAFNQMIQIYVSSQKITTPFFYQNIISIFISIYFGKKYIVTDNYREMGFCYIRIIQESFNVIFSSLVMMIMANRESLIKPNLQIITKNFWNYFVYNMKTSLSFYGEVLAFEMNTYFAARLNDLKQLAGFVGIVNCLIFVFFMSIGFSNTFRTNIGNLLGEGHIQEARANTLIYTIYVFVIALILIFFLNMFLHQIAVIYAGKNDATPIVEAGIKAYYWNIFPTFILYSLCSIMRFLNYNELAVKTTMILMPILVFLISGFLAFKMDMKTVGLVYGILGSKVGPILIFFYMIYTSDWKKQYNEFKKNNANTENLGSEKSLEC